MAILRRAKVLVAVVPSPRRGGKGERSLESLLFQHPARGVPSRSYSSSELPFKRDLVDLLKKAKYEEAGANKIVEAVDKAILQGISRHEQRFMTLNEYEKILRTIQEGVEAHKKEMQQLEATAAAALATDYDFVLGEVGRTRQRIKEEAQQLESNVQLDLNLERKRRTDLLADVEGKGTVAGSFLERRTGEIEERLRAVAKQAMRAIIALGTSMLGGFVGYKFYMSP